MRFLCLILLCATFAASPAFAQETQVMVAETATANPFFVESDLPYSAPRFDLIEDAHYLPAFERGMVEEIAEIERIANNPEAATFDNTIVAMERTGVMLSRVSRVFFNMTSANTNDTLNEVRSEISPRLAAHNDQINLNSKLFARVDSLYEQRGALDLDPESLRLLERRHLDFVRAGAQLTDAEKDELRTINTELSELSTTFSQNVLDEVNGAALVVDSREELAGLSESMIQSYADEAESRDLLGKFVITLRNTSQQPPLASLDNRDLRLRIENTCPVETEVRAEVDDPLRRAGLGEDGIRARVERISGNAQRAGRRDFGSLVGAGTPDLIVRRQKLRAVGVRAEDLPVAHIGASVGDLDVGIADVGSGNADGAGAARRMQVLRPRQVGGGEAQHRDDKDWNLADHLLRWV